MICKKKVQIKTIVEDGNICYLFNCNKMVDMLIRYVQIVFNMVDMSIRNNKFAFNITYYIEYINIIFTYKYAI